MKLIFVYNADSGMMNTVKDIGHKLLSPATYDCFLCSLTHGAFRENPEWKAFRNTAHCEMVFLHRDEFEKQYNRTMEYPVVLKESNELEVAISKDQLSSFSALNHLIEAVREIETSA